MAIKPVQPQAASPPAPWEEEDGYFVPPPSVADAVLAVRRRVPNDHSCLFSAIAYLAEGGHVSRSKTQELREVCAQDALSDKDKATRALLLGFGSVEEYAEWIRNEVHWGGENEILVLSRHYGVEVAVVSCESCRILCYGSEFPTCKSRIYLLYTGQHYDPIVAGSESSVPVERETRRQPKGDVSLERSALELARRSGTKSGQASSLVSELSGRWFQEKGTIVGDVVGDHIVWDRRYGADPTPLTEVSSGTVEFVTVQNDQINTYFGTVCFASPMSIRWSDGDVWVKHDQLEGATVPGFSPPS